MNKRIYIISKRDFINIFIKVANFSRRSGNRQTPRNLSGMWWEAVLAQEVANFMFTGVYILSIIYIFIIISIYAKYVTDDQ